MRHFSIASLLIASLIAATALTACSGASATRGEGPVLPAENTGAATQLLSPDATLQTVSFPAVGRTSLAGRVVGYKTVAYAVPLAAALAPCLGAIVGALGDECRWHEARPSQPVSSSIRNTA